MSTKFGTGSSNHFPHSDRHTYSHRCNWLP